MCGVCEPLLRCLALAASRTSEGTAYACLPAPLLLLLSLRASLTLQRPLPPFPTLRWFQRWKAGVDKVIRHRNAVRLCRLRRQQRLLQRVVSAWRADTERAARVKRMLYKHLTGLQRTVLIAWRDHIRLRHIMATNVQRVFRGWALRRAAAATTLMQRYVKTREGGGMY